MQALHLPNTIDQTKKKRKMACCFIQDSYLSRRMELFCKNSGFDFAKIDSINTTNNESSVDLWIVNSILHFQLVETALRHSKIGTMILFVNPEKTSPNLELKPSIHKVILLNLPEFSQKHGNIKTFDSYFKNALHLSIQKPNSSFLPCSLSVTLNKYFLRDYDEVSLKNLLKNFDESLLKEESYIESDGTYLTCKFNFKRTISSQKLQKDQSKNKHENMSLIAIAEEISMTTHGDNLQSLTLVFKWTGSMLKNDQKTLSVFSPIRIQIKTLTKNPNEKETL